MENKIQKFIKKTLDDNFNYEKRWFSDEFRFLYSPQNGIVIELVAGFEIDESGGDTLDYLGEFIPMSKLHKFNKGIYVARMGEDIAQLGYLMRNDPMYDECYCGLFDGCELVGVIDRVYNRNWCRKYSNFQHRINDWGYIPDKDINTEWLHAKMHGKFDKYAINYDNVTREEKIKSLTYLYCCRDFDRHIRYGDDYEILTAYCKTENVKIGKGVKATKEINTYDLKASIGGIESDCNALDAREFLSSVIDEVISKV